MSYVTITIKDYDWSGKDFVCPQCKRVGLFEWFQYCPYCGAEIDWHITDIDFETTAEVINEP